MDIEKRAEHINSFSTETNPEKMFELFKETETRICIGLDLHFTWCFQRKKVSHLLLEKITLIITL